MPSKIKQLLKLLLLIIMVLPLLANFAYGEECTGLVRPTKLFHKGSTRFIEIRRGRNKSENCTSACNKKRSEFYMIVDSPGLHYFYAPSAKMFFCYNSARKQIVLTKWRKFLNDKSMCLFRETLSDISGYIELVNTYNNTNLTFNNHGRITNCSINTKVHKRHCSPKNNPSSRAFLKYSANLTSCSNATREFCKDLNQWARKNESSFQMCNEINP